MSSGRHRREPGRQQGAYRKTIILVVIILCAGLTAAGAAITSKGWRCFTARPPGIPAQLVAARGHEAPRTGRTARGCG